MVQRGDSMNSYSRNQINQIGNRNTTRINSDNIKNYYFGHNFLSQNIPDVPSDYVEREQLTNKLLKKFKEEYYMVLSGISGIGKSLLAAAFAKEIKESFDTIFWVDGKFINNFSDIKYSKSPSFNQDIFNFIKKNKALIIIDGLEVNQNAIISGFSEIYKNDSKLIVTTQNSDYINKNNVIELEFLDEIQSEKILNFGLDVTCPNHIFKKIYTKVGGHPLILGLINKAILHNDTSWNDIEKDTESHLISIADDRGQALCVRLLKNCINQISKELSAVYWLGTQVIDENILLELIGRNGLNKLKNRHLVSASGDYRIRIHDIIFHSINELVPPIQWKLESEFLRTINDFFYNCGRVKNTIYFRVLHLHKKKLNKLLMADKENFPILYALIHLYSVEELRKTIEEIDLGNLINGLNYCKEDYFRILSYVECVEGIYRYLKFNNIDKQKRSSFVEEHIEIFKELLKNDTLKNDIKYELYHHLGKLYTYINKDKEAIACFNSVVENISDSFHSKLQLLRLIKDSDTSKLYLKEIFNTYIKKDKDISINIVLAAFEELKKPKFKQEREEFLFNDEMLFEEAIKESCFEGFEHPFSTLSIVGKTLQYHLPRRFIKIAESIPFPSDNIRNKKLLFSAGQLYILLYKSYDTLGSEFKDKAKNCLQEALNYYSKINIHEGINGFEARVIAEAYLLLPSFKCANEMLEQAPEPERDAFWYYRKAQILKNIGFYPDCIHAIEKAIEINKKEHQHFLSTFYFELGKIKKSYKHNDNDVLDEYKKALELVDNEKFKKEILNEIDKIKNDS